jgi:hypothetical protein
MGEAPYGMPAAQRGGIRERASAGVIGKVEVTPCGLIVLPLGRLTDPGDGTVWEPTGRIALVPSEWKALVAEIEAKKADLGSPNRSD